LHAKPQVNAVIRAENEQYDVRMIDAPFVARIDATTCRRACRVTQRAQEMLDLRARIRFDARVSRAAEVT
jgi:hypothetical protein